MTSDVLASGRIWERPRLFGALLVLASLAASALFAGYRLGGNDEGALLTVNTQSVDLINNDEDYQAVREKINDIHSGRHYFNQSSFDL